MADRVSNKMIYDAILAQREDMATLKQCVQQNTTLITAMDKRVAVLEDHRVSTDKRMNGIHAEVCDLRDDNERTRDKVHQVEVNKLKSTGLGAGIGGFFAALPQIIMALQSWLNRPV